MLPRLIALCGNPGSGKTTAAEILRDEYGYEIADDGLPLRQIAMKYMGLTEHQVFTQEGKLEKVELNGRTWTVREILGEIGNAFEEKFGGDIIPMMTHATLNPNKRYVMGSVRREQGFYWKREGALIIEVVNPAAPPSPYEFDRFNRAPVQTTIVNDFLSACPDLKTARRALTHRIIAMIEDLR
jgi:hypothetical protein